MKNNFSIVLEPFSRAANTSVRKVGEAKILTLDKCGLRLQVTVPNDVLEWFVDVLDGDTIVAQDWVDYEGYDDTPRDALAEDMAKDVTEFVTMALASEIRTKTVLKRKTIEWRIGGAREQAVPLPPT